MYLIVGLGNIGKEYQNTRHNIGFEIADYFSTKYQIPINKVKFNADYGTGSIEGKKILLVKPRTFMNNSGEAVADFADYFQIPDEDILIIYDDIELDTGVVRIRKKGGSGTHNGMRSIVSLLDSKIFPRVRIGVGKNGRIPLVKYVLGRFTPQQRPIMDETVKEASTAVYDCIVHGLDYAMNHHNMKKKKEEPHESE